MAETKEIKLDGASIEEIVTNTLKEMGRIYELSPSDGDLKTNSGKQNSFADGDDKQGLINTAEALESFFIPYFNINGIREKFWNGDLIKLEHIAQSIKYLVDDHNADLDNDGTLKLSGIPYINFKYEGKDGPPSGIIRNLDFLDTACFILPALLDAKAISFERSYLISKGELDKDTVDIIPSKLKDKVDERIYVAAKMLKECDLGEGKGWAFTNDPLETNKVDQLYFTWNALESLETFQSYLENARFLLPAEVLKLWGDNTASFNLKAKLQEKRSYLVSTFLSTDNNRLNIANEKGDPIDFGEDDKHYYYNLFVLISLLITGYENSTNLNTSLKSIIEAVSDFKKFSKIKERTYGKFWIAGELLPKHKQQWFERAFLALFTKALAIYRDKNRSEFEKIVREIKSSKYDDGNDLLEKCFNLLLAEKVSVNIKDGVFIWDNKVYSIYYTERVIEAFARLYPLFTDQKVEAYYLLKEKDISQTKKEDQTPFSSDRPIYIDLSVEIQNSIRNIIDAKVKELLSDGKITEQIKEEIKKSFEKETSKDSDQNIVKFFQYASSQLVNDRKSKKQPEQKYKDFAIFLTQILGEILIKSMAQSISVVGEKYDKGKVDVKDLVERLEKGFVYMVDWEVKSGGTDFGKTLSNMEAKEIIEFKSKEFIKKK